MESVEDFDEYFAVYGYDSNPANQSQPYLAEDIIIVRLTQLSRHDIY
jgi:hypothetical protein